MFESPIYSYYRVENLSNPTRSKRNQGMDIGVFGSQSDRQTNFICEAVEFYASILMDEDVYRDMKIDIELDYELDVAGHCLTDDEFEFPREFTIDINPNLCDIGIYSTLAHEMVHVKQYALGELYNVMALSPEEILSFDRVWKGEKWFPKENDHPYFDAPWEVEAFGKEVGLYWKWKHRNMKV